MLEREREPAGLGEAESCAKCGKPTRTWWRDGLMPVCSHCARSMDESDAEALLEEWLGEAGESQ